MTSSQSLDITALKVTSWVGLSTISYRAICFQPNVQRGRLSRDVRLYQSSQLPHGLLRRHPYLSALKQSQKGKLHHVFLPVNLDGRNDSVRRSLLLIYSDGYLCRGCSLNLTRTSPRHLPVIFTQNYSASFTASSAPQSNSSRKKKVITRKNANGASFTDSHAITSPMCEIKRLFLSTDTAEMLLKCKSMKTILRNSSRSYRRVFHLFSLAKSIISKFQNARSSLLSRRYRYVACYMQVGIGKPLGKQTKMIDHLFLWWN